MALLISKSWDVHLQYKVLNLISQIMHKKGFDLSVMLPELIILYNLVLRHGCMFLFSVQTKYVLEEKFLSLKSKKFSRITTFNLNVPDRHSFQAKHQKNLF